MYAGYYSAIVYKKAARAAGHEPVEWRPKSGWRLRAVYDKDTVAGRFDGEPQHNGGRA